jgi:hypothetical protein
MSIKRVALRAKIEYYQHTINRLDREYIGIEAGRAECRLLRSFIAARKIALSQDFARSRSRRLARSSRNRLRRVQTKPVAF